MRPNDPELTNSLYTLKLDQSDYLAERHDLSEALSCQATQPVKNLMINGALKNLAVGNGP